MRDIDPDRAPIFVIGTGRSGTTLLRLMLNAHPRIHLTHEAMLWVLRKILPGRGDPRRWLERYFQTFSFAWLRLDPDAVRRELPAKPSFAQACAAVLRAKARQRGKPRWGDKTPFHTGHLRAIYRDFPQARVVHIVRDPRAAVASLRRMPWGPGTVGLGAFYWRLDASCAHRFRDRLCTVRLEDLLESPRREMERVLAFAGEPWDDAVLEHARHTPPDDVPPFPWLASATEARQSRGRGDGWRQTLTPEQIRNLERQCKRPMRRLGYARERLEREPSRVAQLLAALREAPEGLRYARRLWQAMRALQGKAPASAAESQRLLLMLNPGAWAHYPGTGIVDPPEACRASS